MLKRAIEFGILTAILGPPIWTIVFYMGWGRHFHKQHPGQCSVVKRSGTGSEDFHILSSGMTFVTSGLFLPMANPEAIKYVRSYGKASIQVVDMNNPSAGAKVLPIKHGSDFDPDTFGPHGLSVLEDKVKGEHLVYVVNHVEGRPDRIEKFRYSPKSKALKHEKSIFSDVFITLNDLCLLEEDKFYVSNWMYFTGEKMTLVEHFYHLPLGGIVFYNGADATVVQDRIHGPNGNVLSLDKSYLYVTIPFHHKVQVYKRKSDLDLELVQEISIHTGLDNFHLSENGDALYGGCHPISHVLMKFQSNPAENIAPSQVLRLPLKDGLIVEKEITQEFYDHGELVSGSSVAGVYKNKMLIGSVIDTLVTCDLPTPQ